MNNAILQWAARARQRGYETPEQVVEGLRQCIVHTQTYLARRKRKGYHTDYEDQANGDIMAIAAAIVLIESQSGSNTTEDNNG